MPKLAQHMVNEPLIKMQAEATAVMLALCRGLVESEEDEEDEKAVNGQEIMQKYASETLEGLTQLLDKGINEKYEPLQSYSLQLIGTIAEVIEAEFGQFFQVFMTAFATIVSTGESDTTMEGNLLQAQAIEAMGYIIGAVAKCEDTSTFKD